MKVLFIAGADQQYGTFHMSKLLIEITKREKFDIEYVVITQKYGPLNEWCDSNMVENYVLPYKYCVYYPPKNSLIRILKYLVKKSQVFIYNLVAVREINKLNIMPNIDMIHTNINRDLFGILLSRKYNLPNITYLREFSREHFHLKPLFNNQKYLMNKYSNKFVAISEAVKSDWIDFGLEKRKITVIYDGVDTGKYAIKSVDNYNSEEFRIVMCGAIYEGKGQRDLIEAVMPLIKSGRNISVDFFGDSANDEYYNNLIEYIEINGLNNNICFKGHSDRLNELLGNYDVGVLCSKAEGFGLVTIEYLLSGISVIASNTGANPEILQQGEYGYLYPLGDTQMLSKIILKLYDNRNDNEEKIKASSYAKEKFKIQNTVKQLFDLYSSMVGERQ